MQSTSSTWKALAATGTAMLKTRAIIGGVSYTAISTPTIKRALMQNGLSIGNCVSATCSFSVRTTDSISKSAEVVIMMQLTDGTTTSEEIPAGTFYISHRESDPVSGIVTLECYDALMKCNGEYEYGLPWTDHNNNLITNASGTSIYFAPTSVSMSAVVNNIATLIGVSLDSRTSIQTGSNYVVTPEAQGATMRDVMGAIAAAHGGNWIMTPQNKLRLVPVTSAANAASASSDVVSVVGITGGISLARTNTITGVRVTDTEGVETLLGADTGLVIEFSAITGVGYNTSYLSSALIGKTYQAFTLDSAIYDPAVEVGDYINSQSDVHAVLCAETATLGAAFRGSVSAPEPGEISDEYPYISPKMRTAQLQKAYADKVAAAALNTANTNIQAASAQATQQIQQTNQAIQNLDNSLTQQEIFDRLTDGGLEQGLALESTVSSLGANGEKKLYLDLDYARYGKLIADFIQGGTLTLGGLDNSNGVLNILDASGNVIGTWTKDGITITKGSITGTNNNSWDISGTGQLIAKNGLIGDFTLGNGVLSSTGTTSTSSFGTDGLEYSENDSYYGWVKTRLRGNGLYFYTKVDNDYAFKGQVFSDSAGMILHGGGASEGLIIGDENVVCELNFSVYGTKSRAVKSDQYSDRLLYSYETPSPLFGDVGEGAIADDGKCYIWLDPVFADTISTDQYQVFLQKYGDGDCYVRERKGSYFIVKGTPGLAFGWELKAKQKDYDQKRLDKAGGQFTPTSFDYGSYAARYIEDLQKARESA